MSDDWSIAAGTEAGMTFIGDAAKPATIRLGEEDEMAVINVGSRAMQGLGYRVEVTVPFELLREYVYKMEGRPYE